MESERLLSNEENAPVSIQSGIYRIISNIKKRKNVKGNFAEVESLDYDDIENTAYLKDDVHKKKNYGGVIAWHWIIFGLIGLVTGCVTFTVHKLNDVFTNLKFGAITSVIDSCHNCFWAPLLMYVGMNAFFVFFAAILVTMIEPVAGGSGIPQIKCYLNGIKVPKIVRMKTFFVKITAVLFALSGGLIIGKAATMIHSGAIIAAGISQGQILSFSSLMARCSRESKVSMLRYFRSDKEKRDFIVAGVAAGVAASYGAPLGGLLFAIEDSASFWRQSLIWRTFFCAMVSAFTLNFFLSGDSSGKWGTLSQPGLVNFGELVTESGFNVYQFPFFLLVGIVGGLMGSLFIRINYLLARVRVHYNKNSTARIIEAVSIAIITSLVCFGLSYALPQCKDKDIIDVKVNRYAHYSYYCKEGQYNQMATLFFTTQETTIKELLHSKVSYTFYSLLIFVPVFFSLAVMTSGIAVPSGTFIPSLVTGGALGRLMGQVLQDILPNLNIEPGTFALLGSAAVLSGIFRTPISMTAILIEATNDVSYGLPIMFVVMVSKWIGDFFDEGVYNMIYKVVRFPVLNWDPPFWMTKFKANDIMSRRLVTISSVSKVSDIVKTLSDTNHNGFPVVDQEGKFLGLILRSQLTVLLTERAFLPLKIGNKEENEQEVPVDILELDNAFLFPPSMNNLKQAEEQQKELTLDDFRKYYPRYPEIEDVELDQADFDRFVYIQPYVNPHPYTVHPSTLLSRVFRLFRTMGLRHLCVVDESNHPVGIITRKDLAYVDEDSFSMARGLEFSLLTT